ncbi:MAG: mannose-1-phosphate guanylyltransferase [Actinobacteria bacterium]|nr:mannose-1-phosphate guanylyltransferase [Actinomycetota bacterium]
MPTEPAGQTGNPAIVILAGGVGTRFWPVSTKERPKQFLALLGEESLLQAGYRRACLLTKPERIVVLTNDSFVPLVREQLPDLPAANVIGEPMRRDTAAAICLGALVCRWRWGDVPMVVLTADHRIVPEAEFARVLRSAMAAAGAEGVLYTIGIRPSYAATAYGYLHQGRLVKEENGLRHYALRGFREKPDLATAEEYVRSGDYWWNSGMFVWGVETVLEEFRCHLPRHLTALEAARVQETPEAVDGDGLRRAFAALPAISVDYGLMERAVNVRMIGATFEWSDLGGWLALQEYLPADESGNHYRGRVESLDARGNIVFCADPQELVALVGVNDLIVVRAGRRTLVVPRGRAEEIRRLVVELQDDM